MKELTGTEKQVTWANEIRNSMVKMLDEKIIEVETDKKATKGEVIRNREYFTEAKTVRETRIAYIEALKEVKEEILTRQESRWFITYKNMDSETLVMNFCGDMKETVFFKEV